MLLLPDAPDFKAWLAVPPPGEKNAFAYVVRYGGSGLLEAVDEEGLDEYFDSQEYDDRLEEIERGEQQPEIEINQGLRSNVLYLPCSLSL